MNKQIEKLRDQSTEELEALHLDTLKELFLLRNELSANKKIDKPHLITELKKRTARILSILNERKRAANAAMASK